MQNTKKPSNIMNEELSPLQQKYGTWIKSF